MSEAELISACLKNDKTAKQQFFETYYSKLAYISLRYSKNQHQADQALSGGFHAVFNALSAFKPQGQFTLEEFAKNTFILHMIRHIKSIRNEYYVASTVRAVESNDKSYDLFIDTMPIDLKKIDQDVLLRSIQNLVPSQRLAFNLHIIDTFTLAKMSEMLETSEQTIKSNLEKARFNLQKSIEKNLKLSQYEQSV